MTLAAKGADGRAVDYVLGIERQLKELGIADAAVAHFARAVTAAI
jgi:cation transport regulator ChaC